MSQVEQKYQHKIRTTTEFEKFSLELSHFIGETVSASTLKRLWGYVNDNHDPRLRTLDMLSRYLDFDDFRAFTLDLKAKNNFNSSFFATKQIQTEWLTAGDEVEIGWAPNRYVRLLYKGDNQFEVVEALHTKLLLNDRFECTNFLFGYPLVLPYILRGDQRTLPFIAGRNEGLTFLNVVKS